MSSEAFAETMLSKIVKIVDGIHHAPQSETASAPSLWQSLTSIVPTAGPLRRRGPGALTRWRIYKRF